MRPCIIIFQMAKNPRNNLKNITMDIFKSTIYAYVYFVKYYAFNF